jgi:hypothetical protein
LLIEGRRQLRGVKLTVPFAVLNLAPSFRNARPAAAFGVGFCNLFAFVGTFS